MNEAISENPLKQKSRTYPVDMIYPTKRVFISSIKIPKGYKLDYISENHSTDNEHLAVKYKKNIVGDIVQISFSYYFKKAIYPANDYLKIKLYFDEIIKKANEKVVFAKTQ